MVMRRRQQQSESGQGPSETAEDCRRRHQWWPYDPNGSGSQVTDNALSSRDMLAVFCYLLLTHVFRLGGVSLVFPIRNHLMRDVLAAERQQFLERFLRDALNRLHTVVPVVNGHPLESGKCVPT